MNWQNIITVTYDLLTTNQRHALSDETRKVCNLKLANNHNRGKELYYAEVSL